MLKQLLPLHRPKYILLIFFFSVFIAEKSFSVENKIPFHLSPEDSIKRVLNKDARRAALMSLIIPGLGQAYNKKLWYVKIPLIYAAFGGLGYFALKNNDKYQNYHHELEYRYTYNQTPNTFKDTTTANLIIIKDLVKKHRDFLFIGMGIVYLINIIDANVTAHLKTFDVSDKLSMSVSPRAFYCRNSPYGIAGGVSLSLNFK
jgi:hypothetical protein